jgi:selenocysteine lyase/cysteine desulfurase
MMDTDVRLVAISHVPTNGGAVNPAEEIGKITGETDTLFLLDACQSAGQMDIDVRKVGCDILSATGRKYLRGPRGTGFLYVRNALIRALEPPFIDLHGATWTSRNEYTLRQDARRFESWESYVAGKIGLGAALDYALGLGLHSIRDRVQHLARELRTRLRNLSAVTVHDRGRERCGLVTFTVHHIPARTICSALAERHINVSVTKREATRIDMEDRGLEEIIRASVHYYNTEAEIDSVCETLQSIIKNASRPFQP